jgi:hypothetical protein
MITRHNPTRVEAREEISREGHSSRNVCHGSLSAGIAGNDDILAKEKK